MACREAWSATCFTVLLFWPQSASTLELLFLPPSYDISITISIIIASTSAQKLTPTPNHCTPNTQV